MKAGRTRTSRRINGVVGNTISVPSTTASQPTRLPTAVLRSLYEATKAISFLPRFTGKPPLKNWRMASPRQQPGSAICRARLDKIFSDSRIIAACPTRVIRFASPVEALRCKSSLARTLAGQPRLYGHYPAAARDSAPTENHRHSVFSIRFDGAAEILRTELRLRALPFVEQQSNEVEVSRSALVRCCQAGKSVQAPARLTRYNGSGHWKCFTTSNCRSIEAPKKIIQTCPYSALMTNAIMKRN